MRFLKSLSLTCLLLLPAGGIAFAQTPEPPPKAPDAIAPADIIPEADTTLRALHSIENDLQSDNSVSTLTEELADFDKKTGPAFVESKQILASSPSLDRLRFLNETWTFRSGSLLDWKKILTKRSKELSQQLAEVDQTTAVWQKTRPTLPAKAPELSQRAQAVLSLAQTVRPKIVDRQKELLGVESKLADEDSRIHDMLLDIQQGNSRAISDLAVQDAPALWSPEFRGSMDKSIHDSGESWANQSGYLKTYLMGQKEKIFIQVLLVTLFIVLLFVARKKLRAWAGEDPELKTAFQIFETPIAAAFLLTLVMSSWLYPYAPNLWKGFLGAFLLIPTMVILHRLVERRLFPVLNSLVFFYFLDQVRLLASAQPGLSRMIFLFESICAITFLAWLLLAFKKKATSGVDYVSRAVQIGGRLALVIISFGLLANLAGYQSLGNLLLNGVLRSSYVAVIFYASVHVLQALILASFKTPFMSRLGIIKAYRELLLRRIFRILNFATAFAWLSIMLTTFSLRETVFGKVGDIVNANLAVGSLNFTLLNLITFGLTIWAAFLISRLVRFILDHDIYPHFRLAHGVPYAISTMLHYSILLLAFFMATAALGIDMTKFTILVSAFGVGIGFGLQNIINNFVSGLILLFERPIKVGDSVQVGDAIGTVRRIGIRASVLRTNNGTEIIVPNATLISSNVTNWTLSKQRRIIVLPINVARGPDPDHIIDLLKKEAAAHRSVLKEPAPEVIIVSLAANLSFELRVWTADVSEWTEIRSDLFLSINGVLAKEDIKPA